MQNKTCYIFFFKMLRVFEKGLNIRKMRHLRIVTLIYVKKFRYLFPILSNSFPVRVNNRTFAKSK